MKEIEAMSFADLKAMYDMVYKFPSWDDETIILLDALSVEMNRRERKIKDRLKVECYSIGVY